jgi:hypothetical protein
MTDGHTPGMPQPPEGFQRPGIPGAGNLLDPDVRGDLRERLRDAAHGAGEQMQGQAPATPTPGQQPAPLPQAAEAAPPAAEPPAAAPRYRTGPFPHGDVDLTNLVPNVLPGVRPNRGRAGRKFYFLGGAPAHTGGEPPVDPAAARVPGGPKPG